MNGWVVIDTNVLLVAEGLSTYTRRCCASCGNILVAIRQKEVVVLDANREMLKEYGNKLSQRKGQPGLGYEFWKWLVNTKLDHSRLETVNLTAHPERGYEEFPDHEGLREFDRSDRKFVAAAAAHRKRPRVVQAGDSKWWGWRKSLSECGIELDIPGECEEQLRAKWEAKMGG